MLGPPHLCILLGNTLAVVQHLGFFSFLEVLSTSTLKLRMRISFSRFWRYCLSGAWDNWSQNHRKQVSKVPQGDSSSAGETLCNARKEKMVWECSLYFSDPQKQLCRKWSYFKIHIQLTEMKKLLYFWQKNIIKDHVNSQFNTHKS